MHFGYICTKTVLEWHLIRMCGTQSSVPQCKNQVQALHKNNKCQCVKQVRLIHHCANIISSSLLMDLKEERLE